MTISPGTPDLSNLRAKLPSASPARAWKAVRELVLSGGDQALALADEFATAAGVSTDKLLRLWPQASDPDAFAEVVLAPALVREERTALELGKRASLDGVRHLATLQSLSLYGWRHLQDLTAELATLTGLTDLRLGVDLDLDATDTAALAGLTSLTRLSLRSRRLANLSPLRDPLAELCRLTELTLVLAKIDSLAGTRALTSVTDLDLYCPRLTTHDGIVSMPSLRTLSLHGATNLQSLDGLGHYPHLTKLSLPDAPLPDLRPLARLPALTAITISRPNRLTSLDGLQRHPALNTVCLYYATDLRDFSALGEMPALRTLELYGLDQLTDLSPFSGLRRLEKLTLYRCRSLADLGVLSDLPSLKEINLEECPAIPSAAVADLRVRGILNI